MITIPKKSTRTCKHNRDLSADENAKKQPSRKNSRRDLDNVGSAYEQRENSGRNQNKVLSFSIEAILSSPHPKRESARNNVQNKHIQVNPQTPDQTRTALNTLEEFTSSTLKDASDERCQNQTKPTVTLEQKLAALQARLNHRKRRKPRTCFTNQQIAELERRFVFQKYLSPSDRDELSMLLGLSGAQIITWFQNRRARFRRDVEELKCDVQASSIMEPTDIKKMCKDLEI